MKLIINLLAIQWIALIGATQLSDDGAIELFRDADLDEELDRIDRAASGTQGDDGTEDNRYPGPLGVPGLDASTDDEGTDGICTHFEDSNSGSPPDMGVPNTPTKCGRAFDPSTHACCNGNIDPIPTQFARCCKKDRYKFVYNYLTHICLDGRRRVAKDRLPSGSTPTCGTTAYDPATQVCCRDGVRYRISTKGDNDKCCGQTAFNSAQQICCDGRLSDINGFAQPKCCNNRAYDAATHICCSGRVRGRPTGSGEVKCCRNHVINTARQLCCLRPDGRGNPSRVDPAKGCYYCNNRYMDITTKICCSSDRRTRAQPIHTGYCCGDRSIRGNTPRQTYVCCEGILKAHPLNGDYRCCGRNAYDCNEKKCENGDIIPI